MSPEEQQAQQQTFALQQEWRALITGKLTTMEAAMATMSATLTNLRLEVVTHKHREDLEEKIAELTDRVAELEKTKLKSIAIFATLNMVAVVAWAVFTHFWPSGK